MVCISKKYLFNFFLSFLLDVTLSSTSFKSLQGFLCLLLCERKRKKKIKKKICSFTPGYVKAPFGLTLPNSSIPGFVGWQRCNSTSSFQQQQQQQ
jgi:hypothetical protein